MRTGNVIKLGPVTVTKGSETPNRMALLLWGAATCGKTTFAATAPGDKLWLSFGDQEHIAVAHRKDVLVADLSGLGYEELFKHAQSDNPFGLDQILAEQTTIETVVADSLTAVAFRALQKAVRDGVGGSKNFRPSMESPGISAYGGRNAIVLEVVTGLLRVTAKHGVNIVLTTHEDDATTNSEGVVEYVSMMLGGKLVGNMTYRLSEIWYMSQEPSGERRRRLAVRPTRMRKPMKTRMFSNRDEPEFVLKYDADLPDKGQMTIEGWLEQWRKNAFMKIPIPKYR